MGRWELFMCSHVFKISNTYIYIYIHIYIYMYITCRASRLIDHSLDADQEGLKRRLPMQYEYIKKHENGWVGGGKEAAGEGTLKKEEKIN